MRGFASVVAALIAIAIGAAPTLASERCAGQAFALTTAPGGYSPYIRLDADGRSGAFQLDYGSTLSSISAGAIGHRNASGAHEILAFSLPTFARGRFQLARYGLLREPPGGQLGIVGTDFLAKLTADFTFDSGDVVLSAAACDAAMLRRRGMVAIRQAGSFSSDIRRVRSDRPNVPVLPLRLGGIRVMAQIDTGYDDTAFPPSIDINDALYQRLVAERVDLRRIGTVSVTTCQGRETREVYEVQRAPLAIVADDGTTLRDLPDARLVRKAVASCGGIASMAEPAAQLGISVLRQMGSIVFDPKNERVWIPAPPASD